MYSGEYASGFSGPAAWHLAAPLRLVTKAMPDRLLSRPWTIWRVGCCCSGRPCTGLTYQRIRGNGASV